MLRSPHVLLLCSAEAEADSLRNLLDRAATVTTIRSLTDLKETSEQSPYDALFCGWSFHRSRWKDALSVIQITLGDLPIVFLSRAEDEREWKDVLDAGGFDLLLPPFSESQALSVLVQAVESQEARGRHGYQQCAVGAC